MDNNVSTQSDDSNINAGSPEPSLADLRNAMLNNSPMMEEIAGAQPENEEVPEIPSEEVSVAEDPEETSLESKEEIEEVEETNEEAEEEEAVDEDDEESTQEATTYTADDLDLEAQIKVKVDGEEMDITFGDLIKGYQTDQHLSKKGREISETQKKLEEDFNKKFAEVDNVMATASQVLTTNETHFATEYHNIEKKIEEARDKGDTFDLGELKDKREQIQKKYWDARNYREKLEKDVAEQKEQVLQSDWNAKMESFKVEVVKEIPDYTPDHGNKLIDFAVKEGIPEDIIPHMLHPKAAKFVNDYYNLKNSTTQGVAKRKAAPTKKALPTKKTKPAAKKKAEADQMVKARAFKKDASPAERRAFLLQHASKSLSNLK